MRADTLGKLLRLLDTHRDMTVAQMAKRQPDHYARRVADKVGGRP